MEITVKIDYYRRMHLGTISAGTTFRVLLEAHSHTRLTLMPRYINVKHKGEC